MREGQEITIDHDVIDISGNLILEKDKKAIARKLYVKKGYWGKKSGVYYPDQLLGIAIEGHYGGIFLPQVFKETRNL